MTVKCIPLGTPQGADAEGERLNELCQHWTPQQALAVYECLEQLMQTIWSYHEDELCVIFAAECLSIPEPPGSELADEFDDAIPF